MQASGSRHLTITSVIATHPLLIVSSFLFLFPSHSMPIHFSIPHRLFSNYSSSYQVLKFEMNCRLLIDNGSQTTLHFSFATRRHRARHPMLSRMLPIHFRSIPTLLPSLTALGC
jgi:hypothetical protein